MMSFDTPQFIRVSRRLQEAAGYFELGMTQHTLDCLEGLGELGPFEPAVEFLRGESLRIQHRYDDAATSLEAAAKKFPAPLNRSAWLAVSRCYRQAGQMDRAIQTLGCARGARPPKARPKAD